jgi:L-asparaginase/Glu-tRNA(Gln) amidotransferase subunit D
MAELPSVLMLFTGGTISGRGAVPARGGHELLETVPRIGTFARITCEDFDRLPGPHWTPERMMELAAYLDLRLATDAFDGAVVTHGTDTLEETAYLLDLVLRTGKPVVLTGAMKTADDAIWDGPGNLIASVQAVAGMRGQGLGVAAMMGETLHAARQVAKSHTESFAAFSSSHGGPMGELETTGLQLYAAPMRRERFAVTRLEARVDLVTACVGADAGRRARPRARSAGARERAAGDASRRARGDRFGSPGRRVEPLRAWPHGTNVRLRGRRAHAERSRRHLFRRSCCAEGPHQADGAARRGLRHGADPGVVRAP